MYMPLFGIEINTQKYDNEDSVDITASKMDS